MAQTPAGSLTRSDFGRYFPIDGAPLSKDDVKDRLEELNELAGLRLGKGDIKALARTVQAEGNEKKLDTEGEIETLWRSLSRQGIDLRGAGSVQATSPQQALRPSPSAGVGASTSPRAVQSAAPGSHVKADEVAPRSFPDDATTVAALRRANVAYANAHPELRHMRNREVVIEDKLYRSGEIRASDIPNLVRMGITDLFLLRTDIRDYEGVVNAAKEAGINLHLRDDGRPIVDLTRARVPTADEAGEVLAAVQRPGAKVWVSCKGGIHRTGAVIGAVMQARGDWSPELAKKEWFRFADRGPFGWFTSHKDLGRHLGRMTDDERAAIVAAAARTPQAESP